eukprot:317336-Chlamydomonas_euryale.AAC.1
MDQKGSARAYPTSMTAGCIRERKAQAPEKGQIQAQAPEKGQTNGTSAGKGADKGTQATDRREAGRKGEWNGRRKTKGWEKENREGLERNLRTTVMRRRRRQEPLQGGGSEDEKGARAGEDKTRRGAEAPRPRPPSKALPH